MKLLYVQLAKVIWLFDTRLINPRGLVVKDFFAAIKDRYDFANAPLHEFDRSDKGSLRFEGGSMHDADERAALSVTFNIYNDGIVAQTSSNTDHTTAFLQDLREFAIEWGFSIPSPSSINKGFVSLVIVETEFPLLSINPKLMPIIEFIQSKMSSLDGKPREFDLTGIEFSSEDRTKNHAPAGFTFERRLEQPFSANRYYSEAPLQTKDHLKLLDMLEGILRTPARSLP